MDLPRPASLTVVVLVPLATSSAAAVLSRRIQRALDEAGWEVLRRSTHDPVTLTRQVLAGERDPSLWTRLHARVPAPRPRPEARPELARGEEDGVLSQRIRSAVSSSSTSRSAAGRRGQEVHSGSGGSR